MNGSLFFLHPIERNQQTRKYHQKCILYFLLDINLTHALDTNLIDAKFLLHGGILRF